LIGPSIDDAGWRGKIAREIFTYLERCDISEFNKIVGTKKVKITDESDRKRVLADIKNSRSWWGRLSPSDIKKLTTNALESIKDTVCYIDERVTIDTKRLIRYPNSLHGKSGLIARSLSYEELEAFDPLRDAVAFNGEPIKVYVKDIPRIRLGEEEIGPLKDTVVVVPKAIGIYLLCRGAAEPR
jgi:DNA primase small subunit